MVVPDDLERAGAAHEAGRVLDAMLTTFCPVNGGQDRYRIRRRV
jgi:hypothetical protein